MIRIWGRRTSSNVQKVLWCCEELGLAFERIDLGGPFGGTDSEAYRKLNPNGLIPTIEDGGFVLWESNAILRYLVDKYGAGRLSLPTPEGRADVDRWMTWEQTVLLHRIFPVFFALVRTPEAERDQRAIERDIAAAEPTLQLLDRHLADREYVTGDSFTIGDMPASTWTYRWFAMGCGRIELPHLRAWYDRLARRPAYRTHVMIPLS